jgi:hypothetical protein
MLSYILERYYSADLFACSPPVKTLDPFLVKSQIIARVLRRLDPGKSLVLYPSRHCCAEDLYLQYCGRVNELLTLHQKISTIVSRFLLYHGLI